MWCDPCPPWSQVVCKLTSPSPFPPHSLFPPPTVPHSNYAPFYDDITTPTSLSTAHRVSLHCSGVGLYWSRASLHYSRVKLHRSRVSLYCPRWDLPTLLEGRLHQFILPLHCARVSLHFSRSRSTRWVYKCKVGLCCSEWAATTSVWASTAPWWAPIIP